MKLGFLPQESLQGGEVCAFQFLVNVMMFCDLQKREKKRFIAAIMEAITGTNLLCVFSITLNIAVIRLKRKCLSAVDVVQEK